MEIRPNVFLVESNETDEMLARRAIAHSGIHCDVRVARDGAEACEALFGGANPAPSLILLALNMPIMDGFEVLTRIRANENTKRLPVVVFSNSDNQIDVDRCFDLHASSYVQKDKDLDCYETRLKLVLYYWIAVNRNGNA